jgi:hypothetical protein
MKSKGALRVDDTRLAHCGQYFNQSARLRDPRGRRHVWAATWRARMRGMA